MDRRTALKAGIPAVTMTLAGCVSGGDGSTDSDSNTAVQVVNDTESKRLISISITSVPDEDSGFTKYFSDAAVVAAADRHTFEDGLPQSDHSPAVVALVAVDDERVETFEFEYSMSLATVRVKVLKDGRIELHA